MGKIEYEWKKEEEPNLAEVMAAMRGICSWCVLKLICGEEMSVAQVGKTEENPMKYVVKVAGRMTGKTGCGLG